MALTNSFYEAVESNSVRRVRIMMKDSLLVDPTFLQFKEMEKAASGMGTLYDEHDGRDFKLTEDSWNDDYMNELMVQVVGNFSHERIEHLKDVVRYLRPVSNDSGHLPGNGRTTEKQRENTCRKEHTSSYQEQKRRDQLEGNYKKKKIAAGAVAGGIVGSIIAIAVEIPVYAGILAGAGVAGLATYMGTEETD